MKNMNTTLNQFITDFGYSQSQIAAQLGKSPATINQYLNGKYKGDTSALDRAVAQLIERHKTKSQEVQTDFVPTPTAKRIIELCAVAHAVSDIYLLIGEAGLGKTMALKEYKENNAGVILLEVDPTYSPKVLLAQLCQTLSIINERTNHAMFDAVVEKLKGSQRLLIVDEAELLNTRSLEILRRIHDRTGIGVVLAGMPRLRANLKGARGEFKQLYSRIGLCLDLKDRLPEEDLRALVIASIGENECTQELIKASNANARRLSKILRGVKRLALINDTEINPALIERFTQMLIN